MASLLTNYEYQFGAITASITSKTAALNDKSTAGDDWKLTAQLILKECEEAKDILEQMVLEVRELDSSSRNKYFTRIESYKAELSRLEKEFKIKKNLNNENREELFGDIDDFNDQKQLLIDNSEKLERGIKRLDVGYKVAIETEQIGNHVLNDLNQQRETIQRTRNRLRETDEDLSRSGRMLNRMLARIIQNRLIFLGLFFLSLIIVMLVLYFQFQKKH